jgi:uncharacterized membrane protein YfcA
MWMPILLAVAGVVLGTVLGSRMLARIPDVWFHRVLAVVLAALGITMVARGLVS